MVFNVQWDKITPGHLKGVNVELISKLSALNIRSGGRLFIHRLYDPSASSRSQHFHGTAADVHIEGLSVIDQYLMAERINFGGVGVYGKDVWTRTPGLHVDVRSDFPTAKWGCKLTNGRKDYVALDQGFFIHLLKGEYQ